MNNITSQMSNFSLNPKLDPYKNSIVRIEDPNKNQSIGMFLSNDDLPLKEVIIKTAIFIGANHAIQPYLSGDEIQNNSELNSNQYGKRYYQRCIIKSIQLQDNVFLAGNDLLLRNDLVEAASQSDIIYLRSEGSYIGENISPIFLIDSLDYTLSEKDDIYVPVIQDDKVDFSVQRFINTEPSIIKFGCLSDDDFPKNYVQVSGSYARGDSGLPLLIERDDDIVILGILKSINEDGSGLFVLMGQAEEACLFRDSEDISLFKEDGSDNQSLEGAEEASGFYDKCFDKYKNHLCNLYFSSPANDKTIAIIHKAWQAQYKLKNPHEKGASKATIERHQRGLENDWGIIKKRFSK